jgi:hypothetical protein
LYLQDKQQISLESPNILPLAQEMVGNMSEDARIRILADPKDLVGDELNK